jgi:hypothetical protein
MMLRSGALDRLLNEFGATDRVESFAKQHGPLIGYTIARNGSLLGCLLLVSLQNDHGLSFEDLAFSHFVSPSSLQFDRAAMLSEVKNKSQKHALDWVTIEQDTLALDRQAHDPWQMCCGLHLLEVLAIGFRRTFASHNKGEATVNILARSLRLAYSIVEFAATALYHAIRRWEVANPPFRILAA